MQMFATGHSHAAAVNPWQRIQAAAVRPQEGPKIEIASALSAGDTAHSEIVVSVTADSTVMRPRQYQRMRCADETDRRSKSSSSSSSSIARDVSVSGLTVSTACAVPRIQVYRLT